MWYRGELKDKAKSIFKKNYWRNVGATFIFTLLTAVGTSTGSDDTSSEGSSVSWDAFAVDWWVFAVVGGIVLSLATVGLLIDILVRNPIQVGYANYVLACENGDPSIGQIFTSLKGYYISTAIKMFTTKLFCFLWSLLFLIPGIIKSYEYRMVPYLLAENMELTAKEAREKSKEMMMGQKWKSFVLDLSFIGWYILSCFTAGILSILYVDPYVRFTECELYKTLKK